MSVNLFISVGTLFAMLVIVRKIAGHYTQRVITYVLYSLIPIFFLSLFFPVDSSESVKQRNDVFYLQPERSCVPNSPMWYSTFPLDPGTLDTMLTRILMVREVHEELAKAKSEDSDVELSD